MKSNATSLYIHIPFCKSICTYCDFKKFIYNQDRVDKYFKALIDDVSSLEDKSYLSIYIGGGTPSAINYENLEKLLVICRQKLSDDYIEYTIESNVEDIDVAFLTLIKKYGVNRLSIGVQSFNDKFIKLSNRHHSEDIAIKNIELASKYISNISIDMIFAFPLQTIENINEEIKIISNLPIKHISYYSLLIEPNTILWAKKYENVADDVQAEMYKFICEELAKIGYNRYEISNFSLKGNYESYHNKVYWHNEKYDAIGISASGYDGINRYKNDGNIIKYISGERLYESFEKLSQNDIIFNEIMLNLRLDNGLDLTSFEKKYKLKADILFKEAIEYCEEYNLIRIDNNMLKTTFNGSLLLNTVLEKFLECIE